MIKTLASLVLLFANLLSFHVFSQTTCPIIPKPQQITFGKDSFALHDAKIVFPKGERSKQITQFFIEVVKEQTGIDIRTGKGHNPIQFSYSNTIKNWEGYKISITKSRIDVVAKNDTGLFWAVQTLRQLLPLKNTQNVYLPCLEITDHPKYGWRGNMLDVSRHFFSVEYIKRHIDLLSYYKMNVFHWHLTDDQGWRIEIKKYPRLTQVGAWRKEPDDSTHGGFYTQEQIKEVVKYAEERNITVIPEIEMPGHCMAALAAYPEFSCTKAKFEVPNYWGVIQEVYCAGNENTYQFVENILSEVLELFPSKYIHIGGDEVPKYRWQQCPECQKKIKEAGLKDEAQLQSYFIQRIEKFLKSKGRVLIGWDEILEGGVGPEAIVEVWRGPDKANEAIGNKNKIIQTLYLDASLSSLTLSKIFEFSPDVADRNEYVLGAECPLWTESQNEFTANYMIFPRLQAFSEILWSGKTNFDDFQHRMEYHYTYMDAQNILYGNKNKPLLDLSLKYSPSNNYWILDADRGTPKIDLRYEINGLNPDFNSPVFADSLVISKPMTISVNTFYKNQQKGFPVKYKIEQNKALGIKPIFKPECQEKYSKGGIYGMTDGITGTMNYGDDTWMGWWGDDPEIIIDFNTPTDLSFFQINCMQQVQPWILLPQYVEFYVSEDGTNWQLISKVTHTVSDKDLRPQICKFSHTLAQNIKCRYVKAVVKSYGKLPEWHNGAGNNAWVFIDEFIVR
jgi:hexosaminidase